MLVPLLAFVIISVIGDPQPDAAGTIQGVVLNGTQGGQPIADIEVQLRAGLSGMLAPVASTKTDIYGKFAFQRLPLDPTVIYLPGANRGGVHYPGQRVRLDLRNRIAHVKIKAFDAASALSPLTSTHHDIDIEVEKHMMKVREALLVSNSSRTTYVGQSRGDDAPVTLCLSIPANFDRVTFDKEFYGRRFRIVDHRVVTDIPWPPGDTELRFTYRIPLEGSAGLFRRPLDLPSSNLRIRVRINDGQQVSCNISPSSQIGDDVVFAVVDKPLPADQTIELQIGNLPIPWMLYARWASLVSLAMLILATLLVTRRRSESSNKRHESARPTDSGLGRRFKSRQRAT